MINYSKRLDSAMRRAAWAHEQAGQHRKGTDVPYIMHPFGTMLIASGATDDEDVLIACLLHDVIEDVPDSIYSTQDMEREFGDRVVQMVLDVSKDMTETNWHKCSEDYLDHLLHRASDEAVVVSMADKIHNLNSILFDYEDIGDELWQRFSTKSVADQKWWYSSVLEVGVKRKASQALVDEMTKLVSKMK